MPPKKKKTKNKLTEVELELMTILWKLDGGTVHDVLSGLGPTRKLAYTSVSTVLRILEQKKAVKGVREGRGHVYHPVLSKEAYASTTLENLVTTVFDGAPGTLVKHLLGTTKISNEDLDEIRALLNLNP